MNLITQILNYFRNLFTSSAYRVAKYNEKNLDLPALIANYQEKTSKEINEAKEKLNEQTSTRIRLTKELENLRSSLNVTLEAIKEAKILERNGDANQAKIAGDIRLMEAKALSRLRKIKALETQIESLQALENEMSEVITEAMIKVEINLGELTLADLNNNIANLTNNLEEINVGGIDEILKIVEGKSALMEARKINKERLGETKTEEKYVSQTDEVYQELQKLLGD